MNSFISIKLDPPFPWILTRWLLVPLKDRFVLIAWPQKKIKKHLTIIKKNQQA